MNSSENESSHTILIAGKEIEFTDFVGINLLISLFLIVFFISVASYPEEYQFWGYEISKLGSSNTPTGLENITSRVIFSTGLIIIGITAIIWGVFLIEKEKYYLRLYHIGFGIGIICVAFPDDIFKLTHRLGAILMFFSLWLLLVNLYINSARYYMKKLFIGLIILIALFNIIYFLHTFHIVEGNNPLWQKISVLFMGLSVFIRMIFYQREKSMEKKT